MCEFVRCVCRGGGEETTTTACYNDDDQRRCGSLKEKTDFFTPSSSSFLLFPPLLPTRFLGVIVPLPPLLARAAMSDERGRGGGTHTRRLTDEGGRRHIRQRSFYQGYKLANLPAQKAQKRLIC